MPLNQINRVTGHINLYRHLVTGHALNPSELNRVTGHFHLKIFYKTPQIIQSSVCDINKC